VTIAGLPKEFAELSHRLTEVPLRSEDDRAQGRHRMLTATTRTHVSQRPAVVAWVRPRTRGPLLVLVGGVAAAPGPGDVAIAFPAGARGRSQDRGEVEAALDPLTWEACQLALDAESIIDESAADRIEDLFALSSEPMGLLVVARPLAATSVGETIDALSDDLARLEALRAGRGIHRRQLVRSERNLEYLDRSAGVGCWQLELWTAGRTAADARGLAALLASSGDIAELPLVVRPADVEVASQHSWAPTCVVGSDVVAALARPPFRELPGVRITSLPDFDQNLEDALDVRLGSILDGALAPAAPFGVSLESVNRHVFVSGATGAGKSETVRSLLWSLAQRNIPWMVIEPAKAEYAGLARWLDARNPLVVIRPGDPDVPPPMLNPLEPSSISVGGIPHFFPLQTHLDMVKALFIASFDADDPFPQVLGAGLTRSYLCQGWNLVTGTASDPLRSAPEWPSLGDLVRESLGVVDGLGYGREVRDNVRGFIRVRVESLRSGTPGRFFEGGYPLSLEDLLGRPTVFEIEDVGDDQDKAFFIGSLIIRLVELLRLRQKHGLQKPGMSHVLVIEEAHRLLRRVPEEHPAAQAVTMFANLLAEIRAYGEGVVVAEQIPSKVIGDLVKNSAVKLMHRLPAKDDRDVVGATMNLDDEQSSYVVALEPGTAVAHSAGMDRPVLVRIDSVLNRPVTGAGFGTPELGRRAAPCPSDCAEHKCTLGEIAASRDLVTPAVALWVEQVVIAHLTWDRIGTPTGTWFRAIQSADRRRARCALGLAVADSVGRRLRLLRTWFDPAEFASEVTERLAAQLESGRGLNRPPARWAVGEFRFPAIHRELREAASTDTGRPHRLSAQWRAMGIDLPGPTRDDQLAQLRACADAVLPVRPVDLAGDPPALDDLARALGVDGPSEQFRIARALASLGLEYKWLIVRVRANGG
jgi:hypothetical protein